MTMALRKQLYNYVPGFKNDKDEEWACYLPNQDSKFLKNKRSQFLVLMDNLDGLKLDLKDKAGDSQRSAEISAEITKVTKRIDDFIRALLVKVSELKARGLKAREDRIAADLGAGSSNNFEPMDYNLEIESEAIGMESLGQYMPRFDPRPEGPRKARECQTSVPGADQERTDEEMDRAYLEGVDEADIEIMEKMRHDAQRFKCRDLVLEVLERYRIRESRVDLVENDLREIERNARKRVAADAGASTS